jgi:hypothetical protein
MILVVGNSKGNKQANKNAAKEKSIDSNKKKRRATKINGELGDGLARGKSADFVGTNALISKPNKRGLMKNHLPRYNIF